MMKRIKMEPEGILSQEEDIMAQLQQDSSDLEVEPSFAVESLSNGDDSNEGVLMQHMDIREPLSTLRNLLEQRLGVELTDYSFWLQDAQMVCDLIKDFRILERYWTCNIRFCFSAGEPQEFGRPMCSRGGSSASERSDKDSPTSYKYRGCVEACRGLHRNVREQL